MSLDELAMGKVYGSHLLGDLAGCDPAKMKDGEFVYRFLQKLVKEVGMNPIGSPHLDLYTGPHKEWDGFSATVHIQTSHITAHLFAFGYVFMDIFSCRPFDFERTKAFVAQMLRPSGSVNWRQVTRGSNFPAELIDPEQLALAVAPPSLWFAMEDAEP
jgi:S-adenosylmethionine/arginine decarboxylase-like enzyme